MIKVNINKTSLQISSRETLATGNVNSLSVNFRFLGGWDNLSKIAVFKNGSNSVSVLLNSDICPIPWEVLQDVGELYVSIRGTTLGGELVLCTENASIGTVKSSLASAIAAEHREATPDVIDALVADVEQLKIGGGSSGTNGKSAYELAVESGFDGSISEWLKSLKGANGNDGVDGQDGRNGVDGVDGYSPVRGMDYWTAADIAAIKDYVDEAILGGEW